MTASAYYLPACAGWSPRRQYGSSLLEVLIALLVLAIGILGAAALQLNALRYSASAVHTSQASFIAYDMLDRIRANVVELADYVADIDGECRLSDGAPASIVTSDLMDFYEAVTCQLPSGRGRIAVDGELVSVAVGWTDSRVRFEDGRDEFVVSTLVGSLQ